MKQDFIWRRPKVNISEELRQKLVQKFSRLSFDERQTRAQQLRNFQITQALRKNALSSSNSPKANTTAKVSRNLQDKDQLFSPKITMRNNNHGGRTQYKTDVRIGMIDDASNYDSPVLIHDFRTSDQNQQITNLQTAP